MPSYLIKIKRTLFRGINFKNIDKNEFLLYSSKEILKFIYVYIIQSYGSNIIGRVKMKHNKEGIRH